MKYSKQFCKYWRNSLADAELGKGLFFSRKDFENYFKVQPIDNPYRLGAGVVEELFKGEDKKTKFVDVIYRPFVAIKEVKHGYTKERAPIAITPIITPATVDINGRIYPNKNTRIPRDLLEPIEAAWFPIGSVSAQDNFLTNTEVTGVAEIEEETLITEEDEEEAEKKYLNSWINHINLRNKLIDTVAPKWHEKPVKYKKQDYALIQKNSNINGASFHIIALYDYMLKKKSLKELKLFKNITKITPPDTESCLNENENISKHIAHFGNEYPLSKAQRRSLKHLMECNDGEILAINGPPGTGKTTMLLSIISTLWADSALKGDKPPVIFATSTNNQAVTNIIDSFEKSFDFKKFPRWLPNINSYGTYYASQRKLENSPYITQDFFKSYESKKNLKLAKEFYLRQAKQKFKHKNTSSTKTIIDLIQKEIKNEFSCLDNIEQSIQTITELQNKLKVALGDSPKDTYKKINNIYKDKKEEYKQCQNLVDSIYEFMAKEPFLKVPFSWVRPIAVKRLSELRLYLKGNNLQIKDDLLNENNSIGQILSFAKKDLNASKSEYNQASNDLQKIKKLFRELKKEKQTRYSKLSSLLNLQAIEVKKLDTNQIEEKLDTTIRFQIFQLATHYWEGRWILEMENLLKKYPNLEDEKIKRGRKTVIDRIHRQLMLTPCVVSTSFMLPSRLIYRMFDNNDFTDKYLLNFIDLLIIDEAGQVLPEVGASSFALAKKALVIGDTKQIEPIYSIPPQVDYGNLISHKLISEKEDISLEQYESLGKLGKLASSGSIMKIAQNSCKWNSDPELERGLYLYEHRRCFDEIISYCNELCYGNILIPLRGKKEDQAFLGPIGYVHIAGKCQQISGGSRVNKKEATEVASWITTNASQILLNYPKNSLSEIIGIITPFSAQVQEIKKALADLELSQSNDTQSNLTVGTIHSFQGAERPIIIFSPTYSKEEDGSFIDSKTTLMNVAVSRAKDSFIVIGDMDTFKNAPESSPRGVLAKRLFR